MKAPTYRGPSVNKLEDLATVLDTPASVLMELAENESKCYWANKPVKKSNGGIRQTYRVLPPLEFLQQRILTTILQKVEFPAYLQGAIKDDGIPRGYIEDASLHAPYRVTITHDIKDFFPSIKDGLVFKIWRDFFGFPTDIARTLTRLTTYRGFVPQGASTSTYIANLVFWDTEYKLVAIFEQRGLIYTRYVDDTNVSSRKQLSKTEMEFVTRKVYGMFLSKKFKPNRKKRKVFTGSNKKSIHGLIINAHRPTMDKKERLRIRAAVKECEIRSMTDRSSDKYQDLYASVLGRVANMRRLHPREAQPYLDRLYVIRPISKG